MTRGFHFSAFFLLDGGEAHDGEQIALFAEMRHGAVQDDFAGTAFAA